MTRLYTVHDNTKRRTKILTDRGLTEFLYSACMNLDLDVYDVKLAVNDYGPQEIGEMPNSESKRYVIEKQLDSESY